jgi:hypothetical protein
MNILPKLRIPTLFNFNVSIPFVSIHTEVWCDSYERMTKNYLVIWVKIHKWHIGFEIGHKIRASFSEDNSLDKISARLTGRGNQNNSCNTYSPKEPDNSKAFFDKMLNKDGK